MLTKNQDKSFTNVRDQGNTVSDISERVLLRVLLKTALAEILISESSTKSKMMVINFFFSQFRNFLKQSNLLSHLF